MKILTINILSFLFSILLISCGRSETDGKGQHKKDPVKIKKVAVGECIKHIIYKRHGSDIEKYDSLWTEYFHELEEYTDDEARIMRRQLDSLKRITVFQGETEKLMFSIDSLKAELNNYKKEVVGYAFAHMFYDGKDTVTAIFVMDTLCGFGEMTLVKDPLDLKGDPIDNTEYSEKVKKGNIRSGSSSGSTGK